MPGKYVLVTGGTGSFGHHIVERLLAARPARIVIFSRDEKKQWVGLLRAAGIITTGGGSAYRR